MNGALIAIGLRNESLEKKALAVCVVAGSGSRLALLRIGESARDATMDPAELAAWTMVASAILNLDETITKE
ncbi:MAG: hypothetical protein ACREEM_28090 [Blastocatellia bacterium]